MEAFVQAKTSIQDFKGALKFMDERAGYYEDVLHEPSCFETHIETMDDRIWFRQLAIDLYDVLSEREQLFYSGQITSTFKYDELEMFIKSIGGEKFICGPVYRAK